MLEFIIPLKKNSDALLTSRYNQFPVKHARNHSGTRSVSGLCNMREFSSWNSGHDKFRVIDKIFIRKSPCVRYISELRNSNHKLFDSFQGISIVFKIV